MEVRLDFFTEIFRTCDLTELRVLRLCVPYAYEGLAAIAPDCVSVLPSLQALVLGYTSPIYPSCKTSDSKLVTGFLESLPPLRAIRFIAEIDDSVLDSTISRHGPSLRRLWFPPPERKGKIFFNPERLARLSKSCHLLEDLAISFRRTFGDAKEVSMYRSLGRLPRLKILALTLDCEDPALGFRANDRDSTPIYPDFDDVDRERIERSMALEFEGRWPCKGHFRHAFMNAALDETLAKSIFHIICSEANSPLERLELRPVRGGYTSEAEGVVNHLGKWWLLESFDSFHREKCGPNLSRIRSPGDRDDEIWGPPENTPLSAEMESIFRKIWPARTSENSAWCDDWRSLPLATD